jgi:hypothetical protein
VLGGEGVEAGPSQQPQEQGKQKQQYQSQPQSQQLLKHPHAGKGSGREKGQAGTGKKVLCLYILFLSDVSPLKTKLV